MSCSFRSRKTLKPASDNSPTTSGPAAVNSSSPTLATPNQGFTSRAMRRATTRSSTSRATASLSRRSLFDRSLMRSSDQIRHSPYAMLVAPALELVDHPQGRARIVERGRADLDRVRPREQQLDRVLAGGDPADADDGRVGKRLSALVDGAHGHGADRGSRQSAPTGTQPGAAGLGGDGHPPHRVFPRE